MAAGEKNHGCTGEKIKKKGIGEKENVLKTAKKHIEKS